MPATTKDGLEFKMGGFAGAVRTPQSIYVRDATDYGYLYHDLLGRFGRDWRPIGSVRPMRIGLMPKIAGYNSPSSINSNRVVTCPIHRCTGGAD